MKGTDQFGDVGMREMLILKSIFKGVEYRNVSYIQQRLQWRSSVSAEMDILVSL